MEGQRAWRPLLAIGSLLTLVGIVAVAAAGRAPSAGEARPSAHAPTLIADYLATLAMLVLPAGVIVVIWVALLRKSYRQQQPSRSWAGGLRALISSTAVVAAVLIIVTHGPEWLRPDDSRSKPVAAKTTKDKAKGSPAQKEYQPQFRWLPMIVVGSLIAGIGGSMAVLAVRRRREELASVPIQATLSEVLSATLDDLHREQDPRKAVIGAYARMVETLAARGVPRRESEAPHEYLARVLDVVRASKQSASRLTSLFERARFSPHEIDLGMKEEAIEALTGLRAELEAGL
jgi:hypothetical protein